MDSKEEKDPPIPSSTKNKRKRVTKPNTGPQLDPEKDTWVTELFPKNSRWRQLCGSPEMKRKMPSEYTVQEPDDETSSEEISVGSCEYLDLDVPGALTCFGDPGNEFAYEESDPELDETEENKDNVEQGADEATPSVLADTETTTAPVQDEPGSSAISSEEVAIHDIRQGTHCLDKFQQSILNVECWLKKFDDSDLC